MTAHWGLTTLTAPALTGVPDDSARVAWVAPGNILTTAWAFAVATSAAPVSVGTPQTATGRPGLAGPYVAWAGTDDGATLNVAVAGSLVRPDPVPYVEKATLWGTHAPQGVAVAWKNDRLYVSWADERAALHLGWSATPTDPASWVFVELPETTIDAPALAGGPDTDLWLAWAGTDGAGTLNAARGFSPGQEARYTKTVLDGTESDFALPGVRPAFRGADTSLCGPQLQADSGSFTLTYVGHNQHVYLLEAFAGSFNRYRCRDTSDAAVAVSGGGFAWRGLDGSRTLNTAVNEFAEMGASNDDGGG